MTDSRLTLHAVVKDDGAMSYDYEGQAYLSPTVADGIQSLRALAQATGQEVEAVLQQGARPPQHIVLKPGGQLQSVTASAAPADATDAQPSTTEASSTLEDPGGRGAAPVPVTAGVGVRSDHAGPSNESTGDARPPVAGPFSGPIRVQDPAQRRPRPEGSRRSSAPDGSAADKPRRTRRLVVLLVTIAATIGLVAGASLLLPGTLGGGEQSPVSVSGQDQTPALNQLRFEESTSEVPGYSDAVEWSVGVDAEAITTASAHGLLVIDQERLTVYHPQTGAERFSMELEGAVDYVVETTIQGRSALLWRVDDHAYALLGDSTQPIRYTLPSGARLSSAGTSVLIRSGDSLRTFGVNGLVSIAPPEEGYTPMALEGSRLISAQFNGPLRTSDYSGENAIMTDLEQPYEGMSILRWVSAGHGLVITVWGEEGASVNSGHRVELVTHSTSDGSILSTTSTTTDVIGEAEWVRGQGYQLAYIGPYLYSMTTGLLVLDGSAQQLDFGTPTGELAPADSPEGNVLIAGGTAFRSDAKVLAVLDSGEAIVRSSPTTVHAHTLG